VAPQRAGFFWWYSLKVRVYLEERGERIKKGGSVEKEERAGGQGQNALLPPLARIRTEVGGGLGRWRPAGLPGTVVDDERGKRRRAMREFFSHPHLGLGCTAEADRGRRRTAGWGSSGGGAVECNGGGEMACGGAGWGGEHPTTIYRRGKAVEGPGFGTRSLCGQQWRFEEKSHR
jgi:hypothetical protein